VDFFGLGLAVLSILMTGVGIWIGVAWSKRSDARQVALESRQGRLEDRQQSMEVELAETRKQLRNMENLQLAHEKLTRRLMDDPDQPSYGGPATDNDGKYTGGNVILGYTTVRAGGSASVVDVIEREKPT